MKEIKKSYLWLLIAAVLLFSLQLLAVVIYIYSFIPFSAFWSDPFFKGVEPNRDALFYVIFLGTSVILMALSVIFILPQLDSSDYRRKFKLWLGLECVWCFLMVFCFFKWTTFRYPFWNILAYENSAWVQPFFCVVCGLAVLSKIFFPEVEKSYGQMQAWMGKASSHKPYTMVVQIVFILGVVILLYIPKPEDVAALGLAWDQWNHLDPVAGWFIRHGWYLSYEQIIQILVVMAIVYVVGLFYFIRLWLNSWILAAIGSLLAIKMGMFYYGSSPCIWINPANTFLAHGWDVILFFGLWWVSFKYPKKFYAAAGLAGIILVLGWFKSSGYLDVGGLDNQPMMAPLRVRQFFPFFMGYFVPIFYVFSLLVLMGQKNDQNNSQLRLPVVLCIYGLVIFVDYIERPAIGYYGALIVPAILVALWWGRNIKREISIGILILIIGALLTNRLMMIYPNSIFQDDKRFVSERTMYEHFDAVAQSASLIRQLVKEDQKAVVLSNFETALLMQAHRQPLFNNFPVMYSGLNNGPGGLRLSTKKQCLALMNGIADENALYVFVDERLLALSPQALGNSGLNAVLVFLREHYQVYAHQGFLVALQRK